MLRCRVRAEDADLAQGVLALLGAEGFELRDAEVDAAVPDGEVWILVYGDDAPIAQLAQDASSFERWLAPPELESIASVDWAEAWRVYFSPLRLSPRLAVVPSWEEWTPPKGVFVIPVDPGSAFGTGQHETTALCAQAIDQIAELLCAATAEVLTRPLRELSTTAEAPRSTSNLVARSPRPPKPPVIAYGPRASAVFAPEVVCARKREMQVAAAQYAASTSVVAVSS